MQILSKVCSFWDNMGYSLPCKLDLPAHLTNLAQIGHKISQPYLQVNPEKIQNSFSEKVQTYNCYKSKKFKDLLWLHLAMTMRMQL